MFQIVIQAKSLLTCFVMQSIDVKYVSIEIVAAKIKDKHNNNKQTISFDEHKQYRRPE